ncbi:transcriptional regulator, AraC family [Pedobacter westerhofensis]|uniref:Transcriptional regulator, AraC family n=1 Tax=Pedobacter westerhofensis TaxID=425512 RepID=A0A521FMG0_9SPHI|nr:AraC family transcriptional regulator [Pedobacter westerhofensis]SMO97306.1 transcriptional regulator, AraC family [Pedobacter westerhofensis]
MGILRQFDLLIIKDYVTATFLYEPHGHTYYELIYIFKGKGIHLLNHNRINYQAGDLFLISPGDHHHFEIRRPTRFVVIKFTEGYFAASGKMISSSGLSPLDLMRMSALKESKLTFGPFAATSLKNIISNITLYKDQNNAGSSLALHFQILSVFGLIEEVRTRSEPSIDPEKSEGPLVIDYIHQNIYDPQMCRIKNIAAHFNISLSYFGDYFRRNYGISYREYIKQYRLSLIQKRIEGGTLSLKQIAREFGFNDESHLSNFFRNQLNLRPAAYRKEKSGK